MQPDCRMSGLAFSRGCQHWGTEGVVGQPRWVRRGWLGLKKALDRGSGLVVWSPGLWDGVTVFCCIFFRLIFQSLCVHLCRYRCTERL